MRRCTTVKLIYCTLDLYTNLAFLLGLRIAWCKASARAHRWQEECILIQEEMRQSLVTFKQQAIQWEMRGADSLKLQFCDMEAAAIEGRSAYAARQTSLRRDLASFCRSKWSKMLEELANGPGGIALDELVYKLA